MNAPGHILTQCPGGHQVQVALEHAGKLLACPVCGATFTAGAAGGTRSPVQFTEFPMDGTGTIGSPVMLRYADTTARMPVRRPRYTKWMLGLWIVALGGMTILSSIFSSSLKSMMPPPMALTRSGPAYTATASGPTY